MTNRPINLRSDTVTEPTPAMRGAMYEAEVGDDYYRDDPTVRALEEKAAAILGKESAMFVLSGGMGNLVSLLTLTRPGQSAIVMENSHLYINEAGGLAAVAGLTPRPVPAPRGIISIEAASAALLRTAVLQPPTTLLCFENTNNSAGGCVVPVAETKAICDFAHREKLKVHLDGARLFNAAVALHVPAAMLVEPLDSVTFCLSKGLSCPAGSLVAGSRAFVEEARQWRQMIGGGMRQAGCFAAAGIVALDSMVERLAEDHANAKRLAQLLSEAGLPIEPSDVDTNMVFVDIPDATMPAADFVARLGEAGVVINPPRGRRVRLVTHCGISREDVEQVGVRVRRVLEERHGARPQMRRAR